MKLRNLFVAATIGAGLTVLPAPAADAIGGPNTLTVIAYYSDASKQTLIGQRWSGCGGTGGEWGSTSSYVNLFFPPC